MDSVTATNRALQLRAMDGVRRRLAVDPATGLPAVENLAAIDESDLCEVGDGRLGAIAVVLPNAAHSCAKDLAGLAELIEANVRRTDLLVSLEQDTLVVLAPGLDAPGGECLSERLAPLVGEQLSVTLGAAYRSPLSRTGWDVAALAQEARRRALGTPELSAVA